MQSVEAKMSREDVIARMKAANVKDAASLKDDGREEGERWAKEEATPRQLRELEDIDDADDLAEFFHNEHGSLEDDPAFLDGLAEGALGVWNDVKSEV